MPRCVKPAAYPCAYGKARLIDGVEPRLADDLMARYLPDGDPDAVVNDPLRVTVVVEPDRIVTGR